MIEIGREVISTEIEGLREIEKSIGGEFARAVDLLVSCSGKVILCGTGKSGIIARKIAATLSSTGTPAVYLHSVEAGHGDIGMITGNDVFISVSKSGGSEELTRLIPYLKNLRVSMITVTANLDSQLARESDVTLYISSGKEACPMGLVPTTTTTASLVLGDALAVAALKVKDFGREDFARLHPNGVLGRKLYLRVGELMHTGDEIPLVRKSTSLREALIEIVEKKLGCTGVIGEDGRLEGIITDGDLKRILIRNPDPLETVVEEVMTASPRTADPDMLAIDALEEMEMNPAGRITQLFVVDGGGTPAGLIHIHDIIQAGLK
ncbi:MAG: KpsF/GutQ family sugar-phosphate isomerase [Candidatus Krumholzibacteriales bacterium]